MRTRVASKPAAVIPRTEESAKTVVSVEMLLHFTAVAEEMSFTRAARRLHIDQSWLSHKIRQMESILQCYLFVRSTRHIELTAAGQKLLEYGRRLARAAEEAQSAASLIANNLGATLRIGALPYGFWYPERITLTDHFTSECPDVVIEVINGTSGELLEKVRTSRLDIAFVCGPFDASGFDVLTLAVDQYSILVPAEDPLAKMPEINLKDLKGKKLATIHAEISPQAYADLYGPFLDAGMVPVPSPEFEQNSLLRAASRQRLFILCNQRATAKFVAETNSVARVLADHAITSPKSLVRRQDHRTQAVEKFWDLTRHNIEKRGATH